MTPTLAHGAGRSPGEPVVPLRALAWSPALILLLLGGSALRLTIAYVLFPSSGFESDIASFASWALTLGEHGPAGFYANSGFADYPPAYLYLLWPIGVAAVEQGSPAAAFGLASDLIKLPPILLDLVVGYVIYRLVLGWSWPGHRAEALALGAAALYLFNPVSFYDSALWGQTDAAGALVILLGVAALIRGNSEGAAAMAAFAAAVKPQFGVVLIPLVAVLLIKRHLVRPGSGPHHRPWAPARLARWLARQGGWPRLLTSAVAAVATFYVLALPFFGLEPDEPIGIERLALVPVVEEALLALEAAVSPVVDYVRLMSETAGGYSWLSVNAFNGWALVGSGDTAPLAQSLGWSSDTVPLVGPLPGVVIGAGLLVVGYVWALLRAAARDDRWTLLVAVSFLAIAFFILPTRVHERYIFPVIALLPMLAVMRPRWSIALVLLSAGAFINLHAILTLELYGTDNVTALPGGELFRTTPFIVASAALQTGVGLWVAWQLRPALRTAPDAFDEESAWGAVGTAAAPAPPAVPPPPAPPPVAGPHPGYSTAYPPATPSVPRARPPGALDRLIARFTRPPLRADRSAALAGERGGRIDRIDVLVVLVLVVATTLIRGARLEQPYDMYFDEVYHARTATEFLQHWEYGQAHDIYEFTHPHLAKYAMAWGIRLAGGNEVTGTSALGVPVVDAVIERRWEGEGGGRNGDRLFIASGDELRSYDLVDGQLEMVEPLAATALAVDEEGHRLYVADVIGAISVLDTGMIDARRRRDADDPVLDAFSAGPGAAAEQLLLSEDAVIAVGDGTISTFDRGDGRRLSELRFDGVEDAAVLPWAERLVVDAAAIDDPATLAATLADLLEDDVGRIRPLLDAGGPVVVDAWIDEERRSAIVDAIEAGELPSVSFESGPLLAVGGPDGVAVVDATTLDSIEPALTTAPASGLVLVERGLSEPTLYIASDDGLESVELPEDGPSLPRTLTMPGAIRDVVWNEPANLVHVLGDAPDGGPTVYVVEPHGNAVFADVPLSSEPAVLVADTQPERPSDDRGELLSIAADGSVAEVGITQNAFGWRLPGVLLGALAAGLLYLLARVLFARRSIALIAGALVIAEGMLFANARIAMNDVYVTTFILAAALCFAPVYLGRLRPAAAGVALLLAGIALGLALASKWVGLFAVGGLLLLVLLRSGLGRIIALVGMIALTAVLGAVAVRGSELDGANQNWAFVLLMLTLTAVLAAAMVRRPLKITRAEVWLAVVGPIVVGIAALVLAVGALRDPESGAVGMFAVFALMLPGAIAVLVGVAAGLLAWVATVLGVGPLARAARAPDDGTSVWLRPDRLGGLPWLLTLAVLAIVPVAIYVISYAPWVSLGNEWGLPLLADLPFLPTGDAGQSLPELTRSMYEYHDNLRAEHAASSPWWAWPLDLKPVWFYQDHFAGPTTGLIYDAGNLVIFWMGLPAMAFVAWMSWKRGSLALAMVVLLWAALWLPWARIDRATFQYHVYASLPFLILGLAYFLAELWHGPGPRTWFLARAAAALTLLAVPLLWLLRTPLCILAGTAVAHPDGIACASQVTRTAQLTEAGLTALLLIAAGAAIAGLIAWRAERIPAGRAGDSRRLAAMVALLLVVFATIALIIMALLVLDTSAAFEVTLDSDVLAIMALLVMALPAWVAMRARDARRFVLGVIGAAIVWLIAWYPNLSGLPLPDQLARAFQGLLAAEFADIYQGLLPTWSWDFQFGVNTDPALEGASVDMWTLVIGAAAIGAVIGAAVLARSWPGGERGPGDPSPPSA